jgi:hypothetical protein
MDLAGEGVVEVELQGELVALLWLRAVADSKADVDGTARVGAG